MDNLLERRWSRNATLVQGLAALDIIEELGFGLDRMVAAMAEAGLPAPEFKEIGDTFVVTLYGAAAQLHASLTPGERESGRPSSHAQAGRGTSLTPAERQEWALEHLRTIGPLSPQAYADALGVSIDTAKRDLRVLVAQGRVRGQGTTRDRRYTLTD